MLVDILVLNFPCLCEINLTRLWCIMILNIIWFSLLKKFYSTFLHLFLWMSLAWNVSFLYYPCLILESKFWKPHKLMSFIPFSLVQNLLNKVEIIYSWPSLVAQWLRVCLPMQGTRVRALVWEDPTCCGATEPMSHNCWACASGACAPQ